jgi:uncharacterized protein (TIGR01777 family)
MKVLVTGGTGFIGRHLVKRLQARRDDVTVLSRNPAGAARRATASRILAWDPMAGPPPASALDGVEAIVNLLGDSIAKGRWTDAHKKAIHDSRTTGTRHLVAGIAAARAKPKVLVSGSAIGYYGPHGDEMLDETSPPADDFLAGVAKDWEGEASRAEAAGVRVVRLRTGIALGRDGGALQAMLTPFKLGLGGPIASGRQWMSWIHVADLCGIIMHAIDRAELSGPINGTSQTPVQNREFAKTLGDAINRPAFLPTPAFALRLLLGEMADALLISGQRVLPKRALDSGYRFAHPFLDGALADIFGPR